MTGRRVIDQPRDPAVVPVDAVRTASSTNRRQQSVLIVSHNRETLDGMHDYLFKTGISPVSSRTLMPFERWPEESDALLIFPDDFPAKEVLATLSSVRRNLASLPILVVTGSPAKYENLQLEGHMALCALVLPRPCFGWVILDALRAAFAAPLDGDAEDL